MFKLRSVAGLLPGMLTFVGAIGVSSVAQADPSATSTPLPHGVMRTANGRYTVKMCDDNARRSCLGRWLLPPDWQPGMEIPRGRAPLAAGSPMSPADIQAAYKIPASSAAHGKIVAILDAPDRNAFSDLTGYRSHFKLPALPKCTTANGLPTGSDPPCFGQVNEDGKPSTGTDPSPNDDGETALDMDMISATCPDCSILLVEISPDFCEYDFTAGVATASKLGASAISISIGGPEATDPNLATVDAGPPNVDSGPPTCAGELTWTNDQPGPYSSPGHLVFVASGDFAYNNVNIGLTKTLGGASPSYPSSSPWVIAVGGTTLYSNGNGGGYGEGVWNDGSFGLFDGTQATGIYQDVTTSGCSTEYSMPPWQASVLAGTGCARRATADLSAAAAFVSGGLSAGIAVYQSGQVGGAEGTSASAPLVAALFTRLGLTTEASNDLSWIYSNATAFNDVGSSGYPLPPGASLSDAPAGSSCGKLCTAGTGWDGPTGVGSPNGTTLAALPVSTTGPVPYPDAGVPFQGDAGAGVSDASTDATVGPISDASSGGDATVQPSSDGGFRPGSDASGTGNGDTGNGDSGGCSTAPAGRSSPAGLGWLAMTLGLGLIAARRRRPARA